MALKLSIAAAALMGAEAYQAAVVRAPSMARAGAAAMSAADGMRIARVAAA